MTRRTIITIRLAVATVIGVGFLMMNERAILGAGDNVVATADARIGRPATPMSYAGVARRTTRRAVAVGATRAPVVVAPVVVAPRRCVQAVDAYGRIYTRCY